MPSPLSLALAGVANHLKQATSSNPEAEEAWRVGDLSYKFWKVQKKMALVLTAPGSLKKVLNCSRRLRKTSTALTLAIELCLKKGNAQVRFVAPTQKMLRKIIHPLMKLICLDAPEELKPVWRAQDGLYFFPSTGAELHIAGANNDHEDDSRGTAADLCVIDEAQLIKRLRYLVDDVLMPQLITTGGPLWILLTPPKTPVHECRDYVIEAQANDAYAEFNIYESEYPPPVIEQFCKEAGGAQSTTWLREYMCQFVVDTNFSIVPEWQDQMLQEYFPDEFYKFYFRYEGLDISGGGRHKTANIYGVYDFRRAKLFIQEESIIEAKATTTQALADEIKQKEKDLWKDAKPHLRIADNSNLILLQDLGLQHGIHYAPTTKDTLGAMVNNLRLWVGGGKLIISPKCPQLHGCLKYGVWDDKRVKWEESNVYGHFDALAALMYLVRYVDVVTNPIPKNYGINEANEFARKGEPLEGNAKVLKEALFGKKKR